MLIYPITPPTKSSQVLTVTLMEKRINATFPITVVTNIVKGITVLSINQVFNGTTTSGVFLGQVTLPTTLTNLTFSLLQVSSNPAVTTSSLVILSKTGSPPSPTSYERIATPTSNSMRVTLV